MSSSDNSPGTPSVTQEDGRQTWYPHLVEPPPRQSGSVRKSTSVWTGYRTDVEGLFECGEDLRTKYL